MKPPPPRKPPTSLPPHLTKSFPDRPRSHQSPCSTSSTSPFTTVHPRLTPSPNTSLLNPSDEIYTPRHWTECFDNSTDIPIPSRDGVWRLYDAGLTSTSTTALILLHGGGHSALSWALVASELKPQCPVIAFDARGHGNSTSQHDEDLSADTQVADAVALIETFFKQRLPGREPPKLVICGHSMGGAIAVRIAAAKLLPQIVGLIVIDVVEGTAMSALPYMSSWLQARASSFASVERAIRYVTKAGYVKNTESARLSVPTQLVFCEKANRWTWRTKLEDSEQYWTGWFEGLSSLFLSVPAAKMLVLASADRLDRDLMIAQMQGKFQNILIPAAGHTVHEDQPEQTASVILEYLQRNLFLQLEKDSVKGPIFQQRNPIPPCC